MSIIWDSDHPCCLNLDGSIAGPKEVIAEIKRLIGLCEDDEYGIECHKYLKNDITVGEIKIELPKEQVQEVKIDYLMKRLEEAENIVEMTAKIGCAGCGKENNCDKITKRNCYNGCLDEKSKIAINYLKKYEGDK